MDKVLLVSFAPRHSSAINRVEDCQSASFELEVYQTDADKVNETIFSRIFSTKFPKLILYLLRSDARLFWPWGIDACLAVTIAALLRPRKLLLWDISDINVHLLKPGWKARALRTVERLLLRRADALVLTSPAFFDEYYAGSIAASKVEVIENLLRGVPQPVAAPPETGPCVIVYTGIIRSIKAVQLMCAVARDLGGEVIFHIHGYPDRSVGDAALTGAIAGVENIHYHGRFQTTELPAIYEKAHISWGFVDEDASLNETWLLTNRIYNAVAFGRPALVNAGTTSGRIVEERRIGRACEAEPAGIGKAIRDLMSDNHAAYEAMRASMPDPATAYLDGHYPRMIERILQPASPTSSDPHCSSSLDSAVQVENAELA